MKILLISGSLRKASLNRRLLSFVEKELTKQTDLQVQHADLQTLALPVYDGDIEAGGIPSGVKNLGEAISSASAIIVSSPEYNGSISSPLKNAIDWVSRLRPVPFEKKPVLLMGATPGGLGAIRGLLHTRVPFDALGCFVFPQVFGLAKAYEAFTPENDLIDSVQRERVQVLVGQFINYSRKL